MAGRRVYDHRLREMACEEHDLRFLAPLRIPRSTAASWRRRGLRPVVTLDLPEDAAHLQSQVLDLQGRNQTLLTIIRLLFHVFRATGLKLDATPLPDAAAKERLLGAIERARAHLPLSTALRLLGLSPSRYYAWQQRARQCQLNDRDSCPATHPNQLSAGEVAAIGDMVRDESLRHMPLRSLAMHAQRIGRVFASASTWSRLIHARGWKRPRQRTYKSGPEMGVRATRPDEFWHVDVTLFRLIDGTRVYLHAVIDNFSRRILAWAVALKLNPLTTCTVLAAAGGNLASGDHTTIVCDSGIENVNGQVDALLELQHLRRIRAKVDVLFSNSMIEAFWRSLKHNWLYINPLTDLESVRQLVAFYVHQHNAVMPHSAFHGQTPDEVYFGNGHAIPAALATARARARLDRLNANRSLQCPSCGPPAPPKSTATENPGSSGLLQLRTPDSSGS